DVRLHLGVPAVGLVAEMRSGLEQLLHGDDRGRHSLSPSGSASTEPNDEPCGWHRYGSSVCGMRGQVAKAAPPFKGLRVLPNVGLTDKNKQGTLSRLSRVVSAETGTNQVRLGLGAPTRMDAMIAPLGTLVF